MSDYEQQLKAVFDELRSIRCNMFRLDFEALVLDMCREFDNGDLRHVLISAGNQALTAHREILEAIKDESR